MHNTTKTACSPSMLRGKSGAWNLWTVQATALCSATGDPNPSYLSSLPPSLLPTYLPTYLPPSFLPSFNPFLPPSFLSFFLAPSPLPLLLSHLAPSFTLLLPPSFSHSYTPFLLFLFLLFSPIFFIPIFNINSHIPSSLFARTYFFNMFRIRSYRELPIRVADFGVLHRNELSG